MKNSSKFAAVVIIIIMLTTIVITYKRKDQIVWLNELVPISNINTDKKVVAIACNVYEGENEIKKMLEVLNRKNVKISFFLGGVWVNKNHDTVKLIKQYNQDIQNHGYYHKKPSTLNLEKNVKEIKDTEETIYKITGIRTTLFEPPYGDYDENTLNIVNSLNYKMVTWSVDTIDWRNDATRDIILKRIKKKLKPGAIILIHPKPVTAESLESIIDYIHNEGYEIKPVSELIKCR